MDILRTPDERFAHLSGFPYTPRYQEVRFGEARVRVAFVDEGPRDGEPVLMLHGEPSWSYLYRKLIPVVTAAGLRAIAPDLVGFGRSDKPAERSAYSYRAHIDSMAAFVAALGLERITLVAQDWGGLIGLRLVADAPERFARIVVANTALPTGDPPLGDAFFAWRAFSQQVPQMPIGKIIGSGCVRPLADEVIAAYDAPFPDERYKAGARQFPMLVPASVDDPEAGENRRAWEALGRLDKPLLTAFSDGDPITRGAERQFQKLPGASGQAHTTIVGAGHFLQEDQGERLGEVVVAFVRATVG
jgi:haloalkane dehalogenase